AVLPPSDRDMAPIGMVASRAGGTLRYDPGAQSYLFTVGPAAYRVSVAAPDAGSGQLAVAGRVGEGEWSPLLAGAGLLYRTGGGAGLPPEQAAQRERQLEFRHAARGRILTLRFSEKVDGQSLRWSAVFRLAGRSLTLSIAAPATAGQRNYCGFTLGRL